jgi:ADP-ribose pyrophosphatase YjhB (NUDIX family)
VEGSQREIDIEKGRILMYLSTGQIQELVDQFGDPAHIHVSWEISKPEYELIVASQRRYPRHHDFTLFIFNPKGQLSLIQKHSYPEKAYRPLSGAVMPGEPLIDGILREAYEETGLKAELERFLLICNADFHYEDQKISWRTFVLTARADGEHKPIDTNEIQHAKWGTLEELQGPIRDLFLATGRPLLGYRVRLHDEVAALLARNT